MATQEAFEDVPLRTKRFTHKSYEATLKDVHAPSVLTQSNFDRDLEDNQSHFHEALDHWRQLNLSPGFIKFVGAADGLSASMRLLLHNWTEILSLWQESVAEADDEALRALFDLMQKLCHDLRSTLSPSYDDILAALLRFLPRHISAEVLTVLLATFSAAFKYLLVPSADSAALSRTWTSIRTVLPSCNPEVQRAFAEVWGSLLRRLKSASRITAMELIGADLDGVEDACAWAVVFACKSVSQTLHTASPSIIAPLLEFHLQHGDGSMTHKLLRRVLTALVHHCKGFEQLSPVADVLVERFETVVQNPNGLNVTRMLGIVSVIASVRQGSRLSAKHLTALASRSLVLPLVSDHYDPLLSFNVSILTAGSMALWMSAGRKIVERSWEQPVFGMRCCGALSDLNWGGWKLLELPHVQNRVLDLLDTHRIHSLDLLAALHRKQRLAETDQAFRQKLSTWAALRLVEWTLDTENVEELQRILAFSPALPAFTQTLISIIEVLLARDDPQLEYFATSANSTWVLGSSLLHLSARKPSTWKPLVNLKEWSSQILKKWAWSEIVMDGLVQVVRAAQGDTSLGSFDEIYSLLSDHILSPSHLLRRSILELLASDVISSSASERQLADKLSQAEGVSLDVQGVRERTLRITRLPQFVPEGDSLVTQLAVRWLIAQLKVSLRPTWTPAAKAIATLSERSGDSVWQILFGELSNTLRPAQNQTTPGWMTASHGEDKDLDDVREEERSWRDPSAHKVRSAVATWVDSSQSRWEAKRVAVMRSKDRFDQQSYEAQLLVTLGHCAPLAEKHNRDFIPLFLSLGEAGPLQLPRTKLTAWLALFSKFTNPKALHSSQKLHGLYIRLLSHADRALQTAALSCLLTFKSPHLLPLEDTLRALLDETKWRDELTNLDITAMPPDERPEAVSAIIRLLFGVMLERRGRSRSGDRRAAVLNALAACSSAELDLLIKLMLQALVHELSDCTDTEVFAITSIPSSVSQRQQLGFLNTLADALRSIGVRVVHRWEPLIRVTISITANAQADIDASKSTIADVAEEENEEELDTEDVSSSVTSLKLSRSIRQQGLKRLTDFFRTSVQFDFTPYLKLMFQSVISPRLATLDRENTQSPSALLDLFSTWSSRVEYVPFFVEYDIRVLPQLYACLVAPAVKPPVINRVLDIAEGLLSHAADDAEIAELAIKRHVSILLSNLGTLISNTKFDKANNAPLIAKEISILSALSRYLSDGAQAVIFLSLFIPLLRKPSRVVNERVKVDILQIISSLIPLIPDLSDTSGASYGRTFEALALCFQVLKSRPARVTLTATFRHLSAINPLLQPLAELLEGLNAYSTKRIEEPDFDQRLKAFTLLNETMYASLSAQHWLPVIYNMLSSIQDPNELAIRTSSAQSLKLFIDAVAAHPDSEYQLLFLRKLWPALKNGLRSRNEMVRTELLGVVAHAVRSCDHLTILQDMRVLLAGGDDEASVFANIHHVQLHRRIRALRRLCEFCDGEKLNSSTLADIFVPLIGNFIMSAASVDHQLVNAAITATGSMAQRLSWKAYISLVNQYLKLSRAKDTLQRVYIRTLVSILDSFHFRMGDTIGAKHQDDDEGQDDDNENENEDEAISSIEASRIEDAVNYNLLPALLKHLEDHGEETDDSARLPVAVGIVKVARYLPDATRGAQIGRLLTILSQVFRSKSSDTRDLARETLCKVAIILGPSYLPTILRELRAALTRGPHVHILAFVTHALFVHVTASEHAQAFTDLDACVPDVAHIAAEVVFGEAGREVRSEGFKTKTKEVRSSSSKGLDLFAIMARQVTPQKISGLLLPLRGVMQETEALKAMQLVDDVLRRIAGGLNSNEHVVPTELLVLCHTLIRQNAKFLQDAPAPQSKTKKKDAIVELKQKDASITNHYATNSFRFVVLGLDLFTTAVRRSRFDFSDSKIISRLEPMVAVIGNTLYAANSHVVMQSLKASLAILKCPLKNIDKSLPVFVNQMVLIVQQIGSTESEVVQTALKTLSVLLREKSAAKIGEKDLLYLLELLSPDIEEPTRQASVFAMLRAIVARRFVVPEIYDLMDRVGEVMVTSQIPNVQELCRGVMLQFLLDYPQGKGRLKQQMAFFAKNLAYVYESGRLSVMEILSAMMVKFDSALIEEYADLFFVSLVMVLANDDAPRCREMAAEIIKLLIKRISEEHRRGLMAHIHAWASQDAQAALVRVACQVYGLVIETLQSNISSYIQIILDDLQAVVSRSAALHDQDSEPEIMDVDLEWQAPYQALTTLEKLLRAFPDRTPSLSWPDVTAHLVFPHAWVRIASSRLLGLLFSHQPPDAPRTGFPADGLDLRDIAGKLCSQLKSEHLDAPLSLQAVKNLFWLGKCFCAVPESATESPYPEDKYEDEDEGDLPEIEGAATGVDQPDSPLAWLFSKLSYQARAIHIARRSRAASQENWHIQVSAIFRWFAAMATFMQPDRLSHFLLHILSPVYRIVEETMIKDLHMDELKSTAAELQELLQQKTGTTNFANVYSKIRQHVLTVQHERRTARVTLEALNPEAAAKRRMRRTEVKRDSLKRKNSAFADRKGRLKRVKGE